MADSYTITSDATGEEPYSRTRLSSSLLRSFGHLSGPTLYSTVDWLCDSVEKSLMSHAVIGQLSKSELGILTHEVLKNYDAVAGVQYAAQNGLVSAVNQIRRGRPSLK